MPRAILTLPNSEPYLVSHPSEGPNNLPGRATKLVGRQKELRSATKLVKGPVVRLLTLTGPPGIGKTRLSLEVAESLIRHFPDGVYFVPLATVREADTALNAIAQTLGLSTKSDASLRQKLLNSLRRKQMLLVLDNLEQLQDAAHCMGLLLAAGPMVKILATSRTSLRVYGEHEFQVPALPLPNLHRLPDLAVLGRIASVALFVQRARAVRPDFRLTEANAMTVAEICVRLEGLSLSIELAAARIRMLAPEMLLTRLQQRLSLLTDGPRDLPERQQTLRNAVGWSYDLLPPDEQQQFRQLAVFRGGSTLTAIEAVCNAHGDNNGCETSVDRPGLGPASRVAQLLEVLIASSLVRHAEQPAGIYTKPVSDADLLRFTMLETIRDYALERLVACGEVLSIQQRHAIYFTCLVEQYLGEVTEGNIDPTLSIVALEQDNICAALGWSLQNGSLEALNNGLKLAARMAWFWEVSGNLHEADKSLMAVIATAKGGAVSGVDDQHLGMALLALGRVKTLLFDEAAAKMHLEEGLQLFRDTGDKHKISDALRLLGHVAIHLGDINGARAYYEECLALQTELANSVGVIRALLSQADLAIHTSDFPHAKSLYERAMLLGQEAGSKILLANILTEMGYLSAEQGDHGQAINYIRRALEIGREIDVVYRLPFALGVLGKVVSAQGRAKDVVQIFSAAQAMFDEAGLRMEPPVHTDTHEYSRILQYVKETLGEAAYNAAWNKGRHLTTEQVLSLATNDKSKSLAATTLSAGTEQFPGSPKLTQRELEVLRLVASGMTNVEAAEQLTVTPHTVNMHLRSIYSKLDVATRTAATRYAIANNLI
jgi:predicted ATPase/DNA-binding CsgD family transcriptional regulator